MQPLTDPSWRALALILSSLINLAAAYRPVQFVKHTGQNGRADQAFAITQHFNDSTQLFDLYVRMEAFRYQSSDQGWAALALGPWMTGALMFIVYGDPKTPEEGLTLTMRTADGHTPPLPVADKSDFYTGIIPELDVQYAAFEEYEGQYFSDILQLKPSHIAVAEFIVRGYTQWTGCDVADDTTKQSFIWSSNFEQDFQGDFSEDRNIDMHKFGLGFGFLWVDLLNAAVPEPMFGAIDDMKASTGVNEIGDPALPTSQELKAGDAYIESHKSSGSATATPGSTDSPSRPDPIPTSVTAAEEAAPAPTTSLNPQPGVEQPVQSQKQFNLRSFMWHLHGFFMILAFIFLYPVGIYLLRTPRPTAFNLHWTVNALGTVLVGIGATIGYLNSHGISIPHQYAGIVILFACGAQAVLGWRHHIKYLQVKSKTWMSKVHVWLGRFLLPAAFINIFSGLRLRSYGWFTIGAALTVMAIDLGGLFWWIQYGSKRRVRLDGAGGSSKVQPQTGADAEEYFQLTGDDEFSDSESEVDAERAKKEEERRVKNERLAKLDRV